MGLVSALSSLDDRVLGAARHRRTTAWAYAAAALVTAMRLAAGVDGAAAAVVFGAGGAALAAQAVRLRRMSDADYARRRRVWFDRRVSWSAGTFVALYLGGFVLTLLDAIQDRASIVGWVLLLPAFTCGYFYAVKCERDRRHPTWGRPPADDGA